MTTIMQILFFLTITLTAVRCLLSSNDRARLINRGNPLIRPSEQTTVELDFVLVALNKLDSVRQELGTTFILYMSWTNPRIRWNPSAAYPESFVVYVNEIWTPPLVVSNAIEDSMFLLRDDIFPMRINHNGTVTWAPRLSPTTTCAIDTSLFPVDKQVCDISITSWVHSTKELILVKGNISLNHGPVNQSDFTSEDMIWELIGTTVEVVNLTGGHGVEYQQVNYRLYYRRHERFHWVLLVTPGICLAFLQPLVFLIPLDQKGPRLSYATAMLLSFVLYGRVMNGLLPPLFSSKKFHALGETFGNVLICATIITGLVIVEVLVHSCMELGKDNEEKTETETKTKMKTVKKKGSFCQEFKKKYTRLDVINILLFGSFLLMYIIMTGKFVTWLKKDDSPSVNFS